MKTQITILFVLLLNLAALAQNVGINADGSTPDNSAMLHVKSANKGLLIPQIALTGVNDATTITTPATSLLVYNTTDGSGLTPGYYYNSGTPDSPVWKALISAGGLTNFTESNYLYDSKYGVKLLAQNDAQTNVDMVLQPKGNGAIIADQPDGTTVGGNKRGDYALDLQNFRNNADEVASGHFSAVLGGWRNKASGDYSVAMGKESVASGEYSIAIGYHSSASNFGSVSLGGGIASGYRATALGNSATASGAYSFASGYNNTSQSLVETVMGNNATIGSGNANEFIDTDRLFVVGNGASSSNKRNALTILKNANTTIGGSLTINGNGTGTSYVFPTDRGTNGQVLSTDGVGGTSWTAPTIGTVTGVTGTAPIVSSGGNAPVISISAATTSAAGSMSAEDKAKLNAITGTNTGNQTITLTGDVTGSGTGSFTATISSASVTNAKMANMAANTLKTNSTASSAVPSDLALTANTFPARSSTGNIVAKPVSDFALTLLDDADAATMRTTIGAGTGNGTVTGVSGTAPIVSSGGTAPIISITAATTSIAGSMSAADKAKLDGLTGSQWITSGSNIYYNSGNVGIGTSAPVSKLAFGNNVGDGFDAWTDFQILLFGASTPQASYGIGIKANTLAFNSDSDYDFDQDGSTVATIKSGKVGIGTNTPLATLDLGNTITNRKISLYASADNDHQFTGLGYNSDVMRFQLASTTGNFKFYGATSSSASAELFRIQGDGQIMIPALNTAGVIQNSSTGALSSTKGTANQVLKMNSDGTSTEWGTSIPILTQAQRDALSLSEGMIVYNLNTHKPNYYSGTIWMNFDGSLAVSVGESFQGGVLAYIFQSGDPGYVAGEVHGLIAATSDLSTGIQWYNGSNISTGATSTVVGSGNSNTSAIVTAQGVGSYAAQLCNDYSSGGYIDWFLPSKDELNKLYLNKNAIGGFSSFDYWTSTETSSSGAATQDFSNGYQSGGFKFGTLRVRAIRAF
jgi:hypothetical protein